MKFLNHFALIFLLMTLNTSQISSQVYEEWVSRFNGQGNSVDNGSKILVDNNGNILVGGSITNSSTNSDYQIVKYNTIGEQLWLVTYQGNLNDFLADMVIDKFNNIYVTGHSSSDGQEVDFLTIKYNSSGIQQWISRYNGPLNRSDYANAICIDSVGNTYVTGSGYVNPTTSRDFLTIKYNSTGQIIWTKSYSNENHNDEAWQIAVTVSGQVYVAGWSNGTVTMSDYAVVKYDSSGNQLWLRRYDRSSLSDYCSYMTIDRFENVYLTGYTSITSPDYTTIKYDSSGTVKWIKLYDATGASDVARDIVTDNQNNVYVTGSSIGQGTGYDYVTIKYDSLGNEVWITKYTPGNGLAFSIVVDDNDETYVTGRADGSGTQNDYITVKYDSSGKQKWIARYDYSGQYGDDARDLAVDKIGNVYVIGQSDRDMLTVKYSLLTGLVIPFSNTPKEFELYQNYPNPFNPSTKINYKLRITGYTELKVYDVLGNLVSILVNQKQNAGSYEVEFNGSSLASGIYFYELEVDGSVIDTKRMILIK